MLKAVLDTNVLVSAIWSPIGNASTIVNLILREKIIPFFDQSILHEYRAVLNRPRLAFPAGEVNKLLNEITDRGLLVTVIPGTIVMPDESDRKFYDAAKFCNAYLLTGNKKHYPKDPLVLSPAEFLELAERSGIT